MKVDFSKKRVQFTDKDIFGVHFKSGKKATTACVLEMLMMDRLNPDGTISTNNITLIQDHELWSYIYYLYVYNNESIQEFKQMSGEEGKASAEKMYDVVRSVVDNTGLKIHDGRDIKKLHIPELMKFVGKIVEKYGRRLKNPVIEHYNMFVENNYNALMDRLKIVVRTGSEEARIVTDPKNVQKADIIIRMDWKGGRERGRRPQLN